MYRITIISQAILLSLVDEQQLSVSLDPLVNKEAVLSPFSFFMGSAGEIDVLPSILVDIGISNTTVPLPVVDIPKARAYISKPEFSFVEVDPGGYLVGSKNEIL